MNANAFSKRGSVREIEIERVDHGDAGSAMDVVATEEPLEIRLAYTRSDGLRAQKSISVTLRTPGNDDELAAGFLFTEGIVRGRGDFKSIAPCGPPAPNGLINVVRVELGEDVAVDLERLERHFYTSSSCGVCGKSSLDAVAVQRRFEPCKSRLKLTSAQLGALPEALRARQDVFEQTGGLHASGLFDEAGEVLAVREDVGRHNALDKLIGQALMRDELPLTDFGVVLSGRASFELMQKAMMAGLPFVAAVGPPSSLAVELAKEFDMTLVGFLTSDRFNVYANPSRIL
ncbi:MAG TPA: formate dehydrogenase accessory sulfurtransferase FdhD [Gammaproteobacteria bacterium]